MFITSRQEVGGYQSLYTEFVSCFLHFESGEHHTVTTDDFLNAAVNGS